jgi:hypothetical protein
MSKSTDKKARDEQYSSLIIPKSEGYKKLEKIVEESQHVMDTFRDMVMRNSVIPLEPIFITDGNGRVLSESEQEKLWEEQRREKEQRRYDKLYGKKKNKKKNTISLIPESTEIPNFKPSNFDDWEITVDMENRKFNFYNTRRKANVNIKFDQLGFRVSRKGENVKINTLCAYALLKEYEHEGAGNIVHHARIEREIKSIAVYRRTLQRVFREYLTIRSDSKLFEKIYHDEKDGKQTIVYKCNAELKTAENEYVYNTELIDNATTVEYSDAPRRTPKSTSSDY